MFLIIFILFQEGLNKLNIHPPYLLKETSSGNEGVGVFNTTKDNEIHIYTIRDY
jgi:hypothetical protein